MATDDEKAEALRKLEEEHAKVMSSLGDVWVKVEAVRTSKPTDNLHDLLGDLEKAVDKVRGGGLFGSGAKSHRRALEAWQELIAAEER